MSIRFRVVGRGYILWCGRHSERREGRKDEGVRLLSVATVSSYIHHEVVARTGSAAELR